jgi:ABC-type transporter Mla maintaining outer membrane lipid asymmetry ATPase subunit MlaF
LNQSSTPEPALEARDLSACLGGQEVLNIPSLGVERGEVLVVVGPNGSGKIGRASCRERVYVQV